jgi:hypothetical protein
VDLCAVRHPEFQIGGGAKGGGDNRRECECTLSPVSGDPIWVRGGVNGLSSVMHTCHSDAGPRGRDAPIDT